MNEALRELFVGMMHGLLEDAADADLAHMGLRVEPSGQYAEVAEVTLSPKPETAYPESLKA